MPALVVLKQEGAKLTGSAGPDEGERHEIIEGKVEGSRLTFQVQSPGMKFDLSQEGDEITGEVTRERNGETQKAKLTLKREK